MIDTRRLATLHSRFPFRRSMAITHTQSGQTRSRTIRTAQLLDDGINTTYPSVEGLDQRFA